jgi:inner membrane protein
MISGFIRKKYDNEKSGFDGYRPQAFGIEANNRRQLMARLAELPFPAFLECIRQLLVGLGYRITIPSGRKAWRGRSTSGAVDFHVSGQIGASQCRVLVQVKRYNRPVSRRFVDELRGAILRNRATHGLIVAISNFSQVAQEAAQRGHIAPVRLVDGEELLDCLIAYRVGVRRKRGGRWRIDEGFFRRLAHSFPSRTRPHTSISAAKPLNGDLPPLQGEVEPGPSDGMTWRTHVLGGVSALWLLNLLPITVSGEQLVMMAVGAAIGSLAPDLDSSHSKIASIEAFGIRPIALPSEMIERTLGHRGPLHSLAGLGIVSGLSLLASSWIGWDPATGFCLGYASHLVLDACTKHGIPALYPKQNAIHFLPNGLRFTTGSKAEEVLLPFLASAVVLLFLRRVSRGLWL